MKRILICSHWMEIGGAERALLGLLYSLDYSRYQVDLYLCRHSGEFMKYIPKEVNLLPEDKKAAAIAIPAKEALKNGCADIVLGRLWGKIATARYLKKHPSECNNIAVEYSNRYTYKMVAPIQPEITYDLLISFLEPHYIAANKVHAKKKIAWMHTDYGFMSVDPKAGREVWSKYDAIAAISRDCWKNFAGVFPELEDRLVLIENILTPALIKKQAAEISPDDEMQRGSVKLLSVGRFCSAKNFDNVPAICKRIRDAGLDVVWYLIGYGGSEDLIREKIQENDMENYVIVLGKKENPYPYIKACDLYVQPSRYEGKCVTVREAQILGKPVVITNYATAPSQLENGVDGIVVPMDNEKCAEEIVSLLNDPARIDELVRNCEQGDYANAQEVQKLYQLMED